jgi:ankyrin repeat protein
VVELLLERGANVAARNSEGESALHLAIRHDYPVVAEYLLDHGGATMEEYDREENSPLHKAAFLGRVQFIEMLLKRGADRDEENENGDTPLQLAKSDEVVAALT